MHLQVRGDQVSLESDEIAAGVTSVSLVETEPGIRLRCLEYYDDNDGLGGTNNASSNNSTINRVILLLHGFPDTPMTWNGVARNLIATTSKSCSRDGRKLDDTKSRERFLVVCPELRGYNTEKRLQTSNQVGTASMGERIESYSRRKIVGDIVALTRHYCGDDGSLDLLVGHDWGGAVVWSILEDQEDSQLCPRIAEKAAVLNLPHPLSFGENIIRPKQLFRSWYMFFFQIPGLSEWFLSKNQGSYLRQAVVPNLPMLQGGNTTVQEEEANALVSIEKYYTRVLSQRGFINYPILYYRAAAAGLWGSYGAILESYPSIIAILIRFGRAILRALYAVSFAADDKSSRHDCSDSIESTTDGNNGASTVIIQTPVLVLWGAKDPYLGESLARPPIKQVPKLRGPVFYKTAGHWVHWDKTDEVSKELLKFLDS